MHKLIEQMTKEKKEGLLSNLRYDIPAGIVVFLVAVPLCLGIALASGAPLFSGIIAGMVGGLVVALLSGSALGVSGPAAGLAVIVLSAIQQLDNFPIFLAAVVLAGVIQLALGYLRAGVIGYYFPSSVIKGMLSGIGIIIILKQIPHAVGYDKDPEGDFGFFQRDGHNTITELGYMLDAINPGAVIIAVVAMAILILWERPFMKRIPLFRIVQGPLIAVLSGIGLNLWFRKTGQFSLTDEQVVNLPVADSFEGFLGLFTLPDFSALANPDIYLLGATIAVVASLETLLCVEATDKLDPEKRVTPTNRELKAQGVGNIISGMIGGLPITQVIVRSSANIQSGGKSKFSAFFHGILILITALAIPNLLNLVPLSSLAAILFVVGYKLAKPVLFKEMFAAGRSQFIPFVVTILGIVFTDLLIGIGLGLAVAIVHILWHDYKMPYFFDPKKHEKGEPINIQFAEHVTFINKAGILRTLDQLPNDSHVILDASRTLSMHPDVVEIIDGFCDSCENRNITLEKIGFDEAGRLEDQAKEFGRIVLDREPEKRSNGSTEAS